MRHRDVRIQTDGAGAGTAHGFAAEGISGAVREIYYGGTVFGGTCDLSIVRTDGGTIYSGPVFGTIFPWPGPSVDGGLRFTVAHGSHSVIDRVRIYYVDE